MNRLPFLLILAAIALTFGACNQRSPSASTKDSVSATTSKPQPPSLTDEAWREVQKLVDNVWQKKGDSSFAICHFGFEGPTLVEAKGASLVPRSNEAVSQADRLNGIEWRGRFEYQAQASRTKMLISGREWKSASSCERLALDT